MDIVEVETTRFEGGEEDLNFPPLDVANKGSTRSVIANQHRRFALNHGDTQP